MAELTRDTKIAKQVSESFKMKDFKEYIYRMRQFLAGEWDTAATGKRTRVTASTSGEIYKTNREYPDFRISEHEEGVSNHTMTWIVNLAKELMISRPVWLFPELDTEVSQIRGQYIESRLKDSYWRAQNFTQLISYMVDGIGFARIGIKNNRACARYADTIDLLFDIHARTPYDFRFVAEIHRLNEDYCRAYFGEKITSKLLENRKANEQKTDDGERVIKVIEYWNDTTRAFLTIDGKYDVLFKEENPLGFIPYEAICGPILPSMRTPIPHIINVIGSQVAFGELQRSILEIEKALRPTILIDETAFTSESVNEFYESENVSVLKYSESLTPQDRREAIRVLHVDKIPSELLQLKKSLENEIIRALGVNPYSGGIPQGADFAREVQEVSQKANLSSEFIRQDVAEFYSRFGKKFVQFGRFDTAPITLRHDELVVKFNVDYPIEPLMRDDVACEAVSGIYETKQMQMIKADKLLSLVLAHPIFIQRYPRLVEHAIERFGEVFDVRDIRSRMQPSDEDAQKLEMVRSIPLPALAKMLETFAQMMQAQGEQAAQNDLQALPAKIA